MASGMMGDLPFRINNRPFPHFHDAITGAKAARRGRLNEVHMRPLQAMVVHVIRDFAQ
jgi:hypothetical protein